MCTRRTSVLTSADVSRLCVESFIKFNAVGLRSLGKTTCAVFVFVPPLGVWVNGMKLIRRVLHIFQPWYMLEETSLCRLYLLLQPFKWDVLCIKLHLFEPLHVEILTMLSQRDQTFNLIWIVSLLLSNNICWNSKRYMVSLWEAIKYCFVARQAACYVLTAMIACQLNLSSLGSLECPNTSTSRALLHWLG